MTWGLSPAHASEREMASKGPPPKRHQQFIEDMDRVKAINQKLLNQNKRYTSAFHKAIALSDNSKQLVQRQKELDDKVMKLTDALLASKTRIVELTSETQKEKARPDLGN